MRGGEVGEARHPRRDPLSRDELASTLRVLASVTRALQTVAAGRRATGSDATLVREACYRLGSILAAVARECES